jgi:hypothetical protein
MFGRKKDRKTPFVMEPRADLEDMRDDCVALFLNSGKSFEDVHAEGGPTGPTVSKWLYKETRFPRLDTMRALVRAVGGDIVVVGVNTAATLRSQGLVTRLNTDPVSPTKMDMAAHSKRKKQHRIHRNRSAFRKSANAG